MSWRSARASSDWIAAKDCLKVFFSTAFEGGRHARRVAKILLIPKVPLMSTQRAQALSSNRFFAASLAERDPELAAAIERRAAPPAGPDRADRVGEHRLARGAGGAGLGAHQQIRRGLSGPALLRRLRVRRRRRAARHRARQASCSAATSPTCSRIPASQANQAVFFALLQPGDTFMGMSLAGRRASDPRLAASTSRANGSRSCPTACAARTSASTTTRSSGWRASTSRS